MGLMIKGTSYRGTYGDIGTGRNHMTLWGNVDSDYNSVLAVGNGSTFTPSLILSSDGYLLLRSQCLSNTFDSFVLEAPGATNPTGIYFTQAVDSSYDRTYPLFSTSNVTSTRITASAKTYALYGKGNSLVFDLSYGNASSSYKYDAQRTADFALFKHVRVHGDNNVTDNFILLDVIRDTRKNSAGTTCNAQGSVVKLQNLYTQTAGTLTDSVEVLILSQNTNSTGHLIDAQNVSTSVFTVSCVGDAVIVPKIRTTGSPTLLTVTGPAHTTLTASTEAIDVNVNLARTVQFAAGALTTQRAFVIQAPTYGFASASTITTAVTVDITGAPISGTNATITNVAALRVGGATTQVTAAGLIYSAIKMPAHTVTLTGTTTVTSAGIVSGLNLDQITITDASSATVTNAATLYIKNAPLAAGSITLTNPYSIWVDDGRVRFDGGFTEGLVTLTDQATVALDASLGNVFTLAATDNRTIAAPTNTFGMTGQKIIIRHYASGGARTLALTGGAGGFRFGSTITSIDETASGKTDYIGAIYNANDGVWDVTSFVKGF